MLQHQLKIHNVMCMSSFSVYKANCHTTNQLIMDTKKNYLDIAVLAAESKKNKQFLHKLLHIYLFILKST